MEAHDKKQLAEDTLTEPKGMQALVGGFTDLLCDSRESSHIVSGTRTNQLLRLRYISVALCQDVHERSEALVGYHSQRTLPGRNRFALFARVPSVPLTFFFFFFPHSVRRPRKVGGSRTSIGTRPPSVAIAKS
jgi:hypothetical protein